MPPRFLPLVLIVLTCSCTAGEKVSSSDPDGGLDVDAASVEEADADLVEVDVDAAPSEASAAALPVFTPCLPGWREVEAGGVTTCDPWPVEGEQTCGANEMHLPGHAGCEPIGDACPAGTWAEGLPATGVLYVDLNASGQQLGTQSKPFSSLEQALAAASAGDTIALARGFYLGPFVVDTDVSIVGACAAETKLSLAHIGDYSRDEHYCQLLLDVQGADLTLRNLSLSDSYQLIEGSAGATVALQGVNASHTVHAVGGTLAALDIDGSRLITDTWNVDPGVCTVGLPTFFQPMPRDDSEAITATIVADTEESGTSEIIVVVATQTTCPAPEPGQFPSANACNERVGFETIYLDSRDELDPGLTIAISESVVLGKFETGRDDTVVEMSTSLFDERRFKSPMVISGSIGRGLVIFEADVDISDSHLNVQVEGNNNLVTRHNGVVSEVCTSDGGTLVARDVRNAFTTSRVADGEIPTPPNFYELTIIGNCDATLERVLIDDAKVGLSAHQGARVTATDINIRNATGTGSNPDWYRLPVGIGVYTQSEVSLLRFLVTASAVVGAQIGPDATSLTLESGAITGNVIGANVQLEGYDLGLLQQLVRYEDNQVDIDAQELSLPPPPVEWACDDQIDNDEDGKTDCEDLNDCGSAPACI